MIILSLIISIIFVPFSWAINCDSYLINTKNRAASYSQNLISKSREVQQVHIDQGDVINSAVISFGSGGDVLSPITTFLEAKEYHLVDILNHWGAGPGEVIFEILRRLKHISLNNNIKIIMKGFTKFVPAEKMKSPPNMTNWNSNDFLAQVHFRFNKSFWDSWGYPTLEKFNPSYLDPLVVEFILADDVKRKVKKVFLNPLDYDNLDHLKFIVAYLKNPLKGIFITGAMIPENIELFIDKMEPHGYFVFELFKQDEGILLTLEKLGTVTIYPYHNLDYKNDAVRIVHFKKQ